MPTNRKPKFFYGYVVVALAFLIMVITGGTMYTFGVFFKPLADGFGWTSAATSGAFSLQMVLHGLFYIVTGRLNDRFGPRVVVSACCLLLGAGYLLMSRISDIWQLYLFYGVVIGIGMSGSFVPLGSTVARWFVKRKGAMIGIAVAGISVGTMIMPPVASWLISSYGWRTSYAVMGLMVLVITISAAQFLRRDPTQMRLLPYGQSEVQGKGSNVEVSGFSLQEAMYDRQFWLLCVAYFSFGVFLQAIMVHIVPHATELGISPIAAANIFAAIGGLGIVGRIVMGSASDRIGSRSALIICFVLLTAALAWLLVARELWMLHLFAIVFGFGYGGMSALMPPTVVELFGLRSHGVVLGVITFITTAGGAIGSLMAGSVFDITGSYRVAFLICAALSIIGIILSALLRPPSSRGGANATRKSP